MSSDDRRLIEDYLPIQAISVEAAREKSVRQGHPSTLHLWWARRPLVACRAAVYGALVPVSRFIPEVNLKTPPKDPDTAIRRKEGTAKGLGRGSAAQFVERLCKYPGAPAAIAEAQKHILEAHAERLTNEGAKRVTAQDIVEGRAPRPRVLDMFAGGGAIPLEALRLGCDAYALDLNPVAHIIELCTLVYPQKYGRPDPGVNGCTEGRSWAGLTEEVRHWGKWVLEKVKKEIGDFYPLVPDPDFRGKRPPAAVKLWKDSAESVPAGCLMPVAYLWTRTVRCKNPTCKGTVPLVKQTWLCKKEGRYVGLKTTLPRNAKRVRFEVVEARTPSGLGFDPEAGSKGGNATCPFCGTVADSDYVKAEGGAGRLAQQPMAIVCTRPGAKGKVYLSADELPEYIPDEDLIRRHLDALCKHSGLTIPREPIVNDAKSALFCVLYGLKTWGDIFTPRQMLCLLSFSAAVKEAEVAMKSAYDEEHIRAVITVLGAIVDRLADFNSSLCLFNYTGGRGVKNTFGSGRLPMSWDFAETNPFNPDAASWVSGIEDLPAGLRVAETTLPGTVVRGSATSVPWKDGFFDAVITDPPYYDNVPYADISDFFYVWLRRTIGHLYPEHFASEGTPKKPEAVADATRHGGSKDKARRAYENMMAESFRQAHRVLKAGGQMVVVYAHKTTLGWATLVEALRVAGFTVTEAWPLDTEKPGRLRAQESAALASSILLVARKREGVERGGYEDDVRPELEAIVRERVGTLWEMGISGADLVIACVGAGLRAFTRFARVELANGEEVPAERFLTEVETAVLENILARLSKEVDGGDGKRSLAGVDSATRFYTLWRYTYKGADLDAGEAIIFANGTHVEIDGARGVSGGTRSLVEKKKGKYRLRDYRERGEDEKMGLPAGGGDPAPIIDVLHRTLWLMENRPARLAEFLREAQPNREEMRLVAQALAGPALKGGDLMDVSPNAELSALAKLTANWRSLVEDAAMTPAERDERKTGQRPLDFVKEGRR